MQQPYPPAQTRQWPLTITRSLLAMSPTPLHPFPSPPLSHLPPAPRPQADITTSGGHSSLPPLDGSSAASVAARLIAATDRRPPPVALREPVPQLLAALAPYTPGVRGALFRLAGAVPGLGWLVAEAYLARDTPETAALVGAGTGTGTGTGTGVGRPRSERQQGRGGLNHANDNEVSGEECFTGMGGPRCASWRCTAGAGAGGG